MFECDRWLGGADTEYVADKVADLAITLIPDRHQSAVLVSLNQLCKRADPAFPDGGLWKVREEIMLAVRQWVGSAAECAAELALMAATYQPSRKTEPEPED